jgi:hypothetical protein
MTGPPTPSLPRLPERPAGDSEAYGGDGKGYVTLLAREVFSVGTRFANAASLAVGITGLALLGFVAKKPELGLLVLGSAVLLVSQHAAWRLWKQQAEELAAAKAELAAADDRAPSLSFGLPKLERYPRQLRFGAMLTASRRGRIIRVPVINAQGAGEAKNVHAVLHFNGKGKIDTLFYPLPAQGEWEAARGPPTIEVDLPGNGREVMLNVVAVFNEQYPNAYEWTAASRAAQLRGYAIKTNCLDIEIEVRSECNAAGASLRRTLRVDFHDGNLLLADWTDTGERSNWVAMEPGV